MKYILGIDIGTSNTKAVAWSTDGKVLSHENRSYVFSSEEEGRHELDPEILFDAVMEVIGRSVANHLSHQLLAVSFSSAMHGIIAIDERHKALTNMITWADLRSKKYADRLRNSEEGKAIYERTGTPIHPMSPLCKLMWMREELSDMFRKAHKFISIKEFIFQRLFGEYVIDESVASATGLFDIYDRKWNAGALKLAGIDESRLSTPVPTIHRLSGIQPSYADKLQIPADVPFIVGASDGCLAHIGSNAIGENDISLTIGTSGAVRIMARNPVRDDRQRIFNYILDDDLYVAGGPINNGGNVLQWFKNNVIEKPLSVPDDFSDFIAEAADIAAGCDGLIFLPYIFGERAPVWDADARGVFYGINGAHNQLHFRRAILEGISYALYGILNTLESINGPAGNIYVGGGFIKSPAWVQLLSDVLGKKVMITQSEDSSTAGAVIIAMKALGIIGKLPEATSFFTVQHTFEPDMENFKSCQKNYSIYKELYDHLKQIKN